MAFQTYPYLAFTDQGNLFATIPTDLYQGPDFPDIAFNIQQIIPHDSLLYELPYSDFYYSPSVGLDSGTGNTNPISKPEAMITQFSDTFFPEIGLNNLAYPVTNDSDIPSCITELTYYDDQCIFNPESPNFRNMEWDFEQEAAGAIQHEEGVACPPFSSPQIFLPCHVQDEAESNQLIVENLLKASAESLERKAWDLLKVIVNRLERMVSPMGSHMERVAYYFLESLKPQDAQGGAPPNTLMEEVCMQSSLIEYKALYELYPDARIAHFTANQSILELLNHRKKLHIVDFDVMEGLQWPPLMEALASKSLEQLHITVIKWDDDETAGHDGIWISAAKTKCRLADCAGSLNIPFFYEEIPLRDLKQHMLCTTDEEDKTLVFNMMLQLPHMLHQRSKLQILEFLSIARPLPSAMLTFASAAVEAESKNYGLHLSQAVEYFSAMFESMDAGLPEEVLARTVMEHIFLAPKIHRYISASQRNDEEFIYGNMNNLPVKCGFSRAGCEISEESIAQATQLVAFSRGSSSYSLEVAEATNNEIILKWRDTPMVSVSLWR